MARRFRGPGPVVGEFREDLDRILIEESARGDDITRRFTAGYPGTETVHYKGEAGAAIASFGPLNPKRTLILRRQPGRFVKPFPAHPWYHAGESANLILGFNCLASCHYCFVHTYFDDPFPTIFTNAADADASLRVFLADHPDAWISTGEFMDSLQLDRITGYTERIMETMSGYPRATLELRTKHSAVDHLPRCPFSGVVFSFSVNPPEVTEKIESGSAGFEERLEAAAFLHGRGYRIALRIDPIIATAGYLDFYGRLAGAVERILGWKRVERVFLGVLRFDQELMRRLARGSTSRKFLDAEYVLAPDGKYRLYKQARVSVYRNLLASIRRYNPAVAAALVMEPDYVHAAVTGTD